MPGSRRDEAATTAVETGAAARPPGDVLLVLGEGELRAVPFAGDAVTIGRADDCDVTIEHPRFSRRHARVTRAPLAVQDLGSTNGTRVRGTVLRGGAPAAVEAGETFHIGPFSFAVTAGRGRAASLGRTDGERLLVEDPAADGVAPLVREIATSGVSVLVQGETGVGKDVLATTIHALSGRGGPMMRINCAALSPSLVEAELFGHEKGAFTGAAARKVGLLEAAAGGTVFLDEVAELAADLQAKLLHALEVRRVTRLGSTTPVAIDVRFVAATHRDLAAEVAAGRFRADLFFRLEGIVLEIPPLRARPHRIAPLALRFLHDAGHPTVAPAVLAALAAHVWPGNVRELKAVIERAVLLARGGEVTPRHLRFSRHAAETPPAPAMPSTRALTPAQEAERARVIAALAEASGSQTAAARLLGMSRTTLVNKLVRYGIPRPRA